MSSVLPTSRKISNDIAKALVEASRVGWQSAPWICGPLPGATIEILMTAERAEFFREHGVPNEWAMTDLASEVEPKWYR
ncbi:hypothetical protein [Nocardia sp. NPDC004722]